MMEILDFSDLVIINLSSLEKFRDTDFYLYESYLLANDQ